MELIDKDYESVLMKLKSNNSKDPYIDCAYIRLLNRKKHSIALKLKRVIKHPKLAFQQILINMTKIYTTQDIKYNKSILENKIKNYEKMNLIREE